MNTIQTVNLTKMYGHRKKRVIFKNISLEIKKGEFVAITGPSGCGKSTLLSLLGLLQSPTDGEILIDGISCTKLSAAAKAKIRRTRIGFVFQDFALLGDYSVEQNILLPLVYDGICKSDAQRRVDEVTEILGIRSLSGQYPAEISGGEKQRVAIARTLIRAPGIIFADEPTGNLDPINSEFVFSCFREIVGVQGATIVVVTHDQRLAHRSDRVIELEVYNG